MQKTKTSTYKLSLGLGAVAGMRALSAPALLSHFLVKAPKGNLNFSVLHYLQKPAVATGLKLAAGTELAGDKMPNMADRISPPQLLVRALSGAVVGATIAEAHHDSKVTGALLGGLAAVASSYVFYYLRRELGRVSGWPDATFAVLEDTLALSAGAALLKGQPV